MENKPPVGIMNKRIYDMECEATRIYDILDAIKRYSAAESVIPVEWIDELEHRIFKYANLGRGIDASE